MMNRSDYTALSISILAIIVSFLVHDHIFERMAHIEDEMAYVWQAQAIARGNLTLPSPPEPDSFLIPFVIDYNGQRFGKYPIGWPVILAFGEKFNIRHLINAVFGGLGVWFTYRLGKRIFSEAVGIIAAGLTVSSPFFLMNSGSLLSHPLGLVLTIIFTIAWIDAFIKPITKFRWLSTFTAAFSLGLLAISRPFTAIAICLPFCIQGVFRFFTSDWKIRKRMLVFGSVVVAFASLHFIWQYAATGNAFLNPYTLWWEYDSIGFGPGHGRLEQGHSLHQAWINTRFSLKVGSFDLFGWGSFSWIFIPFGLIAILIKRNWQALLILSIFPSLVVFYLAYWIGSSLLGPRYFYESLFSLTLMSAVGIAWIAGYPIDSKESFHVFQGIKRFRPLVMTAILAFLLITNLVFYIPLRIGGLHGLYGVERSHIEPFLLESTQALAPALIIVHTESEWIEYGTLIELENPYLDSSFIFIISRSPKIDRAVASHFPNRSIYHYYPRKDPFTLVKKTD
jgi:hypothetical protein